MKKQTNVKLTDDKTMLTESKHKNYVLNTELLM